MRIFYSEAGDPMLLDRVAELRALARELRVLATGAVAHARFPAQVDGSPSPYSEFLSGLRIERAVADQPRLRIAGDRWLELTIDPEDLERLCSNLDRVTDGEHTHFYAGPLSLILDADESWSHEG